MLKYYFFHWLYINKSISIVCRFIIATVLQTNQKASNICLLFYLKPKQRLRILQKIHQKLLWRIDQKISQIRDFKDGLQIANSFILRLKSTYFLDGRVGRKLIQKSRWAFHFSSQHYHHSFILIPFSMFTQIKRKAVSCLLSSNYLIPVVSKAHLLEDQLTIRKFTPQEILVSILQNHLL